MKRIAIIGPGGAGKSTLARQIGAKTGLPVIHLDAHYWHEGWVETPKEEWAQAVRELAEGEAWVMDGNYGGTMEIRLPAAPALPPARRHAAGSLPEPDAARHGAGLPGAADMVLLEVYLEL